MRAAILEFEHDARLDDGRAFVIGHETFDRHRRRERVAQSLPFSVVAHPSDGNRPCAEGGQIARSVGGAAGDDTFVAPPIDHDRRLTTEPGRFGVDVDIGNEVTDDDDAPVGKAVDDFAGSVRIHHRRHGITIFGASKPSSPLDVLLPVRHTSASRASRAGRSRPRSMATSSTEHGQAGIGKLGRVLRGRQ